MFFQSTRRVLVAGLLLAASIAGTTAGLFAVLPHSSHAAGTHFVHFTTASGADVWIAPQTVEAVDVAQNGFSYQTRISTRQHSYFVQGTANAAAAALNGALP